MEENDQFMSGIQELDFSMVKTKLMNQELGEGWSQEHCDRVCEEYCRFLALKRAYPTFTEIVPSSPIDTFWHYHILDTKKYADDCQAIFGFFLHHYPYYGIRGGKDMSNLRNSWFNTESLYEKHFGYPNELLWQFPVQCG